METEVEIPPGLMRTWKVALLTALTCITFGLSGAYVGHTTARVVTHVEVKEVLPASACTDVMLLVDDTMKEIHCAQPQQHGHFERHNAGGCDVPNTYLVCSCPIATLDLDSGAR